MKKFSVKRLILIFLLLCAPAMATTYYVHATLGDNSNNGSMGSPFATSGKICSTVVAGDTAYYLGGTFQESWRSAGDVNYNTVLAPIVTGTEANPIMFYADPDSTVILRGDSSITGATLVTWKNCSWITLENFEITNGYPAGVRITYVDNHVTLRNLYVHHCVAADNDNGGGILVNLAGGRPKVEYLTVVSCSLHTFYETTYGSPAQWNTSGIHVYNCYECNIDSNVVHNVYEGFGIRFKNADTLSSASYNTVFDCRIGMGIGHGGYNTFHHNTIYNTEWHGIEVRSYNPFETSHHALYNNTIYRSGLTGIRYHANTV